MSDLVKMLVQATDLAEHQAKHFLQLLAEHMREQLSDIAGGKGQVKDLEEVRENFSELLTEQAAELHRAFGEQLDTIRNDMGELRKAADAALQASTAGATVDLAPLTEQVEAIEAAVRELPDLEKRLGAAETKLKALAKKPATAAA
ncbi:hypothetical protein [Methylobacterium iners]|uniref:Uncharacterized protein n=1 Tax=Methylobacterium iners TaxID=418707 RepID=A0ABQ4RTL7_9HYPH|nr:hypothetical protein [Methylobacterium iners]GJD92895.1 hypothetical protein OCOJLMKI_0078 [Methylobacterium iners]